MSDAVISKCRNFRYFLKRNTGLKQPMIGGVLFVMLNPSTADASTDDPTLRRCIGFAKKWESSSVVVANLYAYRATNPKDLLNTEDPVGPRNNGWLYRLLSEYDDVVCAWGANAKPDRVEQFMTLAAESQCRTRCLGITKHGAPRHPLYIKSDQALIDFR